MAVDNFIYQGINRAVSDYTGAKVCEELINLRPTEGGLVPVRNFTAKFSNKAWEKVFVHYTTSGPKYLAVYKDGSTVKVSLLDDQGAYVTTGGNSYLFAVTGLSTSGYPDDVIEHLSFAAAGNVMLFSICAPTAGKYENHAYSWKIDESLPTPALGYVGMEGSIPNVDYSISDTVSSAQTNIAALSGSSTKSDVVSAVQSGINAVQEENAELCLGPVVIAVAFKTADGQTSWTGKWKAYDPIPKISDDNRFGLTASSGWDQNSTFTSSGYYSAIPYGHAYSLIPLTNNGADGGTQNGALDTITVPGTKVTLTFPAVSGWSKETSIIQSVEVYASKPQVFLDASGDVPYGWWYNDAAVVPYATLIMPQKKYEDMDMGGQLLYHQASIPMESLASSAQTVVLSFGGGAQMTEETLNVDAGELQRYGRVLSYNARFHYFDSVSKTKIGMPYLKYGTATSATTAKPDIFVRYADDDQSGLVYVGQNPDNVPILNTGGAYIVVAPSINIKEVIEYFTVNSYYYTRTYRMTPSSSYNYAICTAGGNGSTGSATAIAEFERAKTAGDIVTNVETDTINVTEQYNPFVFRVEHSYKAPGNVIDVQPQMAGVVDASYGRDPLNVFTERGLYALTQGSANVLYGTFLPLSNLKGGRGGIPVEAGTFFLADGNLWLVSGRRVTLISEALTLGPHKYIRSCQGYKKLSGQDSSYSPTPVVSDPVYDVSSYLSQVEFKVFASGDAAQNIPAGQLSYNRYRMELFISNKNYGYSYVLSLKNWQWHKISRRVWQDEPGSTILTVPGSTTGTISILDMSSEVSSSATPLLIHMQSRPFSMGYQYAHIHRIVTMMRAKLPSSSEKLAVGLYGSEDLQNWTLLSYGKWSGKTENNTNTPLYLSQMRTPSAARSWRYYTICVGGSIPVTPDFPIDLGPVLIDYEPVIRRIG